MMDVGACSFLKCKGRKEKNIEKAKCRKPNME
jgi:hypothetical protein